MLWKQACFLPKTPKISFGNSFVHPKTLNNYFDNTLFPHHNIKQLKPFQLPFPLKLHPNGKWNFA